MTDLQRTIAREVSFEGVGLHTGNFCRVTFTPAPPHSGIRFVRSDLPGLPSVPATWPHVLDVIRGTTLGNSAMRIHTVEHLLSALYGLEIDNLTITVNANEPPVADGSSAPFCELLWNVGIMEQEVPRRMFIPQVPIVYQSGETRISIDPADDLQVTCQIIYDHPLLKQQELNLRLTPESFLAEIARSRTFCFDYEVEALKKQGLVKGGSLENAVVIGMDRIHNQEKALRFPNEFVRHKLLDFLGDLSLIGCRVLGHLTAIRCGHGHNIQFVHRLAEAMAAPSPLASASEARAPR
ncbi:MAG: UDP-3-O-[3-hydroxymyristoyl] N-acetylglucosamine deacetylase [Elusimicrobia bacterium]|nr:UDP-3-O-[3-hydroxymyristoyl] N-acetylglucosamine deacetylase [Elusimicrobiota bacterium]